MIHMNNQFNLIEGYFTWPHLYNDVVVKYPSGSVFVEIGVFKGRSLYFLLENIKRRNKKITVFGVDNFALLPDYNEKDIHTTLKKFTGCYTFIKDSSENASKRFKNRSVDFVFIDAGHDYEDVKLDIESWLPKIKKGGIMAGHDYNPYSLEGGYPGVWKAVNETFEGKVLSDYFDEDCWFVKIN